MIEIIKWHLLCPHDGLMLDGHAIRIGAGNELNSRESFKVMEGIRVNFFTPVALSFFIGL